MSYKSNAHASDHHVSPREPQSETRIAQAESLADSALHDLRNLLASIRANADFIHATLEPTSDPELFGALSDIIASTERIGRVFESTLAARGEGTSSRAPVPLTALVERVVRDTETLARSRNVSVCIHKGEDASVVLDRSLVARMLRTLVEKAVHGSGPGDTVDVSCGVHGKLVVVSVATSNGTLVHEGSRTPDPTAWLDADTQVDIATDELAFCRGVARAHDGTLRIQGRREGGSLVVVSLPLRRSNDASAT